MLTRRDLKPADLNLNGSVDSTMPGRSLMEARFDAERRAGVDF